MHNILPLLMLLPDIVKYSLLLFLFSWHTCVHPFIFNLFQVLVLDVSPETQQSWILPYDLIWISVFIGKLNLFNCFDMTDTSGLSSVMLYYVTYIGHWQAHFKALSLHGLFSLLYLFLVLFQNAL